ncbi:MAG: leucine-rich repeat protein [Clostridia bacterium]
MKKFLISFVTIFVVLTIPFLSVLGYSHHLGKIYDETYLGAMADKYDRLKSIDEPKIVLVGGSNLPFGIDSKLIEEKVGMKVVNFGLYAALGSKTTMDLSKTNINKGDIIIFVPEFSAQTFSKYINGDIMLQALDNKKSMFWKIPMDDIFALAGAYPKYIGEKKEYIAMQTKPSGAGVYRRDAFNEYGDIKVLRTYNIMPDAFDSANKVSVDTSIISKDFITYFNKYASYAKMQGAKLFWSFPPVNKLGLAEDNLAKRTELYFFIKNNFKANVISNIEDYIMDPGYFYDSNFHLNDSGVVARTVKLIGDINRVLGVSTAINVKIPNPSGCEIVYEKPDQTPEDVIFAKDFVYELKGEKIVISGLSEQGKTKQVVQIPRNIDNKLVDEIKEAAFKNCTNLNEIIINENIMTFGNACFDGASNLTRITLNLDKKNNAMPRVGDGLLNGANANFKIYVPAARCGSVKTDYFWSRYASSIEMQ